MVAGNPRVSLSRSKTRTTLSPFKLVSTSSAKHSRLWQKDDGQSSKAAPATQSIADKVHAPTLIDTRCGLRRDPLNTDDLAALLRAQLQTFFPIQAQHALVIDVMAFASQQNAQKAIAPTRVFTSQLLQSLAHQDVIFAPALIAVNTSLQANQFTSLPPSSQASAQRAPAATNQTPR